MELNISDKELKYNAILGLLVSYGHEVDFTVNKIDGCLPMVMVRVNKEVYSLGKLYSIYVGRTNSLVVEYEDSSKEIKIETLLESGISPESYGTILNVVYNATKGYWLRVLTCVDTLEDSKDIICLCKVGNNGDIEDNASVIYQMVNSNYGLSYNDAKNVIDSTINNGVGKFEEFEFRLEMPNKH